MQDGEFIKNMSAQVRHTKAIEKILQQSESPMAFSISSFAYLTNNAMDDFDDQIIYDIAFDIAETVMDEEDFKLFCVWWDAWQQTFIKTAKKLYGKCKQ